MAKINKTSAITRELEIRVSMLIKLTLNDVFDFFIKNYFENFSKEPLFEKIFFLHFQMLGWILTFWNNLYKNQQKFKRNSHHLH